MNTAGIEKVIAVLEDMQTVRIIEKYAIGGAFAAILHNEPISTIDLDIFFFLTEKNESPILSLMTIYDFAKERGFQFDHEFINIYGWLVQFVEASHNALWTEAIREADTIKIGEIKVSLIGREHLMAMWLLAGRSKDFEKIGRFWEAEILDEKKLFDIFERYDLLSKWNKAKWRFTDEK